MSVGLLLITNMGKQPLGFCARFSIIIVIIILIKHVLGKRFDYSTMGLILAFCFIFLVISS